ncbi:MAG: GDSL-type esterase/lipase family protein [Oscillospiraceae bacterium]|nr:GDSL-type esterase/lipase family protein [Oscillospiraceae bacterium]
MTERVTTFAIAQTRLVPHTFNNAQRTMRLIVPNNIEGYALQIRLSNRFGSVPVWIGNATVAICDDKDTPNMDTMRTLTVNGDSNFAIVPQKTVYSDVIPLEVKPGQWIAISLYYPGSAKVESGNCVGNFGQRSVKGDFCQQQQLSAAKLWTQLSHTVVPWDASSAITTVDGVLVHTKAQVSHRVVATFGDSIMQQGTWTTPFTAYLHKKYPGEISLCNMGIGGNRLLHDAPPLVNGNYGIQGMERYKWDLYDIEGLTHVIFCIGTNDLGLPGKEGAPEEELITPQEYQTAVTAFVADMHSRGVKVYGATLLPRVLNLLYTQQRELLRQEINNWIKTCGIFDAVLDFEKVVQAEDGEAGMKKEYDLPDGLHPNLAGGKAIADSIDLELFA